MKDTVAVILAAGRGTRMKSDTPKVLHNILGKSIICRILDSLNFAGIKDIITVVGYGAKLLGKIVKDTDIIVQKDLLGSGDAVNRTKKILEGYSGDVLVICGDTPLIKSETIKELVTKHKDSGASLTILAVHLKDPTDYGRIIRGADGRITKIVEEAEAEPYEKAINEINVGTYCFKAKDLFDSLAEVKPANKKKEFFLTDTIGILHKKAKLIESVITKDEDEIIGVNTRMDLAAATRILKNKIVEDFMSKGITIEDPSSTTIYPDVKIGRDTIIHPNTVIESEVEIGDSCRIGPFAHLRPGTTLGNKVEIGNFVELVRTRVGDGTKIKHHTYLGDATVGTGVNIGAGTITANFDGKNKNKTIIEDGAFIGVDAILIAPVKIGKGALVGAGSVLPKNHNVPKNTTVVGVPARILKSRDTSTGSVSSRAKSRDDKSSGFHPEPFDRLTMPRIVPSEVEARSRGMKKGDRR